MCTGVRARSIQEQILELVSYVKVEEKDEQTVVIRGGKVVVIRGGKVRIITCCNTWQKGAVPPIGSQKSSSRNSAKCS